MVSTALTTAVPYPGKVASIFYKGRWGLLGFVYFVLFFYWGSFWLFWVSVSDGV